MKETAHLPDTVDDAHVALHRVAPSHVPQNLLTKGGGGGRSGHAPPAARDAKAKERVTYSGIRNVGISFKLSFSTACARYDTALTLALTSTLNVVHLVPYTLEHHHE